MLDRHHENLWTGPGVIKMGPGMVLSRHMTVVRLPGGGLWLHSPNEPKPQRRAALDALGPIAWLVAPNCFHHRWVEDWHAAYPEARLVGAPGLAEKRSDLKFHATLGDEPPAEWGGVLEMMHTEGVGKLREVVFFHLPSRTLILTDFAFNHGPASGLPAMSRFMLRMANAYGRFGPSRIFRALTDDPPAVRRSIERMLDRWPVERITMTHGEPVSENAAARLRESYAGW